MASITSVPAFSTEAGYDKLTVRGVVYDGDKKPAIGAISGSGLIQWTSDGMEQSSGWKICGTLKAFLA